MLPDWTVVLFSANSFHEFNIERDEHMADVEERRSAEGSIPLRNRRRATVRASKVLCSRELTWLVNGSNIVVSEG